MFPGASGFLSFFLSRSSVHWATSLAEDMEMEEIKPEPVGAGQPHLRRRIFRESHEPLTSRAGVPVLTDGQKMGFAEPSEVLQG